MGNTIVLSFVYLAGISMLLIFNELIYRKFSPEGEITRKFAHFSAVLATLPFPYFFPSHWYILILAVLFAIVLFSTRRGKLLQSIHGIHRKSIGSYLLPIAIYVTFLIAELLDNKVLFILPILILAVCDPLAAILGMRNSHFNRKISIAGITINKTWVGSSTFLVSSFVICILALYFFREVFDFKTFWLAALVAVVSMFGEMISWRGSDNLSIPLSAVLVLVLFL